MQLVDQVVHQLAVALNETLHFFGVQIVKTSQLEELKFFVLPGIAGAMRLPEVFVETGTYLGNTTAGAAHLFREVHTVELDEKLYKRATERFHASPNVTCHHGNSPDVLRTLAATISEPALFFLDAHWSGGVTAHGDVEVPLLEELEIIRRRPYDDFIVIDDARLVGKAGTTGLRISREYPLTPFDWRHVTIDAIKERLGPSVSIKEAADKLLIDTRECHADAVPIKLATDAFEPALG